MLAHRVLIVDDDPSWQENFKETVERAIFELLIPG
jgi:hypothetical protein